MLWTFLASRLYAPTLRTSVQVIIYSTCEPNSMESLRPSPLISPHRELYNSGRTYGLFRLSDAQNLVHYWHVLKISMFGSLKHAQTGSASYLQPEAFAHVPQSMRCSLKTSDQVLGGLAAESTYDCPIWCLHGWVCAGQQRPNPPPTRFFDAAQASHVDQKYVWESASITSTGYTPFDMPKDRLYRRNTTHHISTYSQASIHNIVS
jgi:hypothetical protein